MHRIFDGFIGIDYSGARTSGARLPGLRVYDADQDGHPTEVRPDARRDRHWTRKGVTDWLGQQITDRGPLLIGIDHGFSFPEEYFARHALTRAWPAFLDDFCRHWPTDTDGVTVDDVRRCRVGAGRDRDGDARWRRLVEQRVTGTKSVFHFDVPGSVAKSTHAGLPWLRRVREACAGRVHVWPFDGWDVPPGRSAIAEIFPSLWRDSYPRGRRTADQHDAYVVAAWLRAADRTGELRRFLHPRLTPDESIRASYEGWILGVT